MNEEMMKLCVRGFIKYQLAIIISILCILGATWILVGFKSWEPMVRLMARVSMGSLYFLAGVLFDKGVVGLIKIRKMVKGS